MVYAGNNRTCNISKYPVRLLRSFQAVQVWKQMFLNHKITVNHIKVHLFSIHVLLVESQNIKRIIFIAITSRLHSFQCKNHNHLLLASTSSGSLFPASCRLLDAFNVWNSSHLFSGRPSARLKPSTTKRNTKKTFILTATLWKHVIWCAVLVLSADLSVANQREPASFVLLR